MWTRLMDGDHAYKIISNLLIILISDQEKTVDYTGICPMPTLRFRLTETLDLLSV